MPETGIRAAYVAHRHPQSPANVLSLPHPDELATVRETFRVLGVSLSPYSPAL
jgi:hypothetical protein